MPITVTFSPAPSRTEPSTFSERGDQVLSEFPTFITEANALEATVNAAETNAITQVGLAEDQVALATAQAVLAEEAKDVSLSAANYHGPWSSCTGAANVPYSVSHIGKYWQLISNLADVTTKTPGTDPEWLLIPTGMVWSKITANPNPAVAGSGYICNTSGGAFTVTLPAAPAEGDIVSFTDGASTFDTNNLTIGRNALKIMGLAEDMTVSTRYAAFSLVYSNATNGWRIA